ncbi:MULTISPECIES: hypothetical protein [unclassified Nostoc]|uniref:hypothetical protein n=1 Tax=unclassified Nostoc TaxID=2593658 RepID=UPI0026162C71|nr:hypothetical protein [Nostoc sp. S13]MDF5734734.1 hypothetical protein [Nostoc sp. S13]
MEILYTIAKVPKHYAANVRQILRNLVVAKSFDHLVHQSQMSPNLEKVNFLFQILADSPDIFVKFKVKSYIG